MQLPQAPASVKIARQLPLQHTRLPEQRSPAGGLAPGMHCEPGGRQWPAMQTSPGWHVADAPQRQRPELQVSPLTQTVPTAPQLARSVWRLEQAPFTQVRPVAQRGPQRPQLAASVCWLRQVELQRVVPGAQAQR